MTVIKHDRHCEVEVPCASADKKSSTPMEQQVLDELNAVISQFNTIHRLECRSDLYLIGLDIKLLS